jgi:hypothetical protein
MRDLYPGYDVLAKRDTPSWNEQTRVVIDRRLAIDPDKPVFFTTPEWQTLRAVCARIVPQSLPAAVPLAAMVDKKMRDRDSDGYRDHRLPPMRQAWRRGLAALDQEGVSWHHGRFHALAPGLQVLILGEMQRGQLRHEAWDGMPCDLFFRERVLADIVGAYYSHPQAWNDIGWGGPAGPRGYVRMDFDRRDPWEAAEAHPAEEERADAGSQQRASAR